MLRLWFLFAFVCACLLCVLLRIVCVSCDFVFVCFALFCVCVACVVRVICGLFRGSCCVLSEFCLRLLLRLFAFVFACVCVFC